jgi:hypothetical protein
MVQAGANPQDMLQTYMGTNSSIAGFEATLSHLMNDQRSELGTQYLYYYFIKPIPRIIWPGKGTPYTWPKVLRGVDFDPLLAVIGAMAGSIGMAYEEWGWLGIPLEFLFAGWLIRKAEEMAQRRPEALHVQLGYAGLYGMLPMVGRDSLLDLIANYWLFQYGIPVFILWRMYKAAERRAGRRKAAAVASNALVAARATG